MEVRKLNELSAFKAIVNMRESKRVNYNSVKTDENAKY